MEENCLKQMLADLKYGMFIVVTTIKYLPFRRSDIINLITYVLMYLLHHVHLHPLAAFHLNIKT